MTSLTKGTRRRRSRNGTLIAALLASTALAGLPGSPSHAQDATWSANPQSIYFDQGANWVGGSVPTGTATFGATSGRFIEIVAPLTMSGWTFTADHPGYAFNAFRSMTFSGAGISNAGPVLSISAFNGLAFTNSATVSGVHINNIGIANFLDTSRAGGTIHTFNNFNFRDASSAGTAGITNFGAVNFYNGSDGGSATIINTSGGTFTMFHDRTTAGSATIINEYGGYTTFTDGSTAGTAVIYNSSRSSTAFGGDSTAGTAMITNSDFSATTFNGSSSAAGATITNVLSSALIFNDSSVAGGTITNFLWSTLTFNDSSTAGTAIINNESGSSVSFNQSSSAGSAAIANSATGSITFSDTTTAGSATIANEGSLQFDGASTAGSATITNNGGSYTLFNHASTAGGATILNNEGGQIFFYSSSTAGGATITNRGAVIFNQDSAAGTSTITNNNVGTILFNDVSTAGSASIINSGYMSLGASSTAGSATITNASGGNLIFADLGSAGSAVIGNAHALFFTGSSTAGNATIANANGALIGFNETSTAGNATITNAGEIDFAEQATTGQAMITNTGIITLLTTDTAGTATVLVQGPGGVLRGYGSVGNTTVEAGGTFMPMVGTLRVNGNLSLSAGSFYVVCSCAQATVTGTATLGGATLVVPQATFQAQSYQILTATGGVDGTFSLTSPLISVLYGTNDVTVSIAAYTVGGALGGTGGTNARNAGGALDRVIVASAGAPPSSLDPLLGLYGAPLAQALNGLSGEAATGAQVSAFTSASTFLGIMLDPMAGARGATAAAPGSSLIEMADTGRTPAGRVAAGWSVWTKAYGQAGRAASDTATGAAGTASSLYGVAAGADRLISPDTLIGFALAGGGTSYGLGARGTGTGDFAQLGFYGSTRLGPGYVSAALAYGWNRFDVSRTAGLGPVETYRSAPTVHTFGGRIEAGRRFGGAALAATPYAALEVIGASTAGYRESWAAPDTGAFALAYAGRTSATARAEAGLRVDSMRAVAPTADLLTFARLAYGFQAGTQRTADASFQQLANSGFTVFGARASTHTALASLGAELRLAAGTRLAGSLDAELGDRHRSLRANLSLRQSW